MFENKQKKKPDTQIIQSMFTVRLIVTTKNDKPAIELRACTTNKQIIGQLVASAYRDKPIIVMPCFSDKLQSLNSLVEKGILYKENDQFYLTWDQEHFNV